MAEYIDRTQIEWYGCNFENASCENRECSGCSHAECSHAQVMQIPTADVIERSKIDKAIEEISEYASIWTSYTMDMSKEQIAVRCLNDYATQFLDILKRNIGEQNN